MSTIPPPPPAGAQPEPVPGPPAPGYPTVSTDAPPPAPTGPSKTNGLGIAAIVLGGIGLVLAFLPFVGFIGGVLAFVGLILGVIGLFQKSKAKMLAIIGTAVSGFALLMAIIMGVVYTAAFVSAVDKSLESGGTVNEPADNEPAVEEEPAEEPAPELGTRDNPAPIGSTVTLIDFGEPVWEVTVNAPVWDVNAEVAAANMFNPEPAAGNQYASVPVSVKYIGTKTGTPQFDLQFKYVSPESQGYDGAFVTMDGQLSAVDELYPDGVGTGTVIIEIPSASVGAGTWSVQTIFGDPIYFAAQ